MRKLLMIIFVGAVVFANDEIKREAIVMGNAFKMVAICDIYLTQNDKRYTQGGDKQLLLTSCFKTQLKQLKNTGNYMGNQYPISDYEKAMIVKHYEYDTEKRISGTIGLFILLYQGQK